MVMLGPDTREIQARVHICMHLFGNGWLATSVVANADDAKITIAGFMVGLVCALPQALSDQDKSSGRR